MAFATSGENNLRNKDLGLASVVSSLFLIYQLSQPNGLLKLLSYSEGRISLHLKIK